MTYQPYYRNLIQLFTQSVEKYGSHRLFGSRKADDWHWTTYTEFAALVAAARSGLHARGVRAGDRVAVISNNRLEWAVGAYGAYTLGAVYVPMYEAQLDKDWQHILADCGAKLCFVSDAKVEKRILGLRAQLPALEHIVSFEGSGFPDLLAAGRANEVAPVAPQDEDCAMFIYTSGTTGNPKGVRLTHFNLASNVCGVLEIAPLRKDEVSLAFLPWAHVFGGCLELNALMSRGDAIAICEDTTRLIDQLGEVKPTCLFAVPRIWNRIYDGVNKQMADRPAAIRKLFEAGMRLKSRQKRGESLSLREMLLLAAADKVLFAKVRARFGGKLRFAFSGAAALAPEVAEFIDNLGIIVYEGYGLTETSGAATANGTHGRRPGSVGRVVPGFELKLDRDAVGATDGEGEILVYGTGVMQGYHNQPAETEHALTSDHGLRTGDLGRIDNDGFLYITGRVKELYKLSNGKYVAPVPLEEKLQLSPYIAQAFVYGSDHPYNTAVIVVDLPSVQKWAAGLGIAKQPNELLEDSRTKALVRREIDAHSKEWKGYEQVREFVLDHDAFTTDNDMLTPTFKLKRRNVTQKYLAKLDALYASNARATAAVG
ncbi:MAG TPA: long-chain fatty acid--CoA ligase [Polyangiales bacterium]|jgi:long-chain acyl-CoA synthetase|nr:long-chain fatty acid--CoA ligase [Polyangiales bacterium]